MENLKSLSKLADIGLFMAEYESFLDAMEKLQGEAGHSEDKQLDIPVAQQSELFNEVHPSDLGVTQFAKVSQADLVAMLGKRSSCNTLMPLMPLEAGTQTFPPT
jgi:hypothetical protein